MYIYIYIIEIVRMTIPHTPFFDHGTISYVWVWPNMADHGTVPNNAGLGGENNQTPSDFRVPNFWGSSCKQIWMTRRTLLVA